MEKSPKITEHSWGKIVLEDGFMFKDAVLFPGGSFGWDWTISGTSHSRGIQAADVALPVIQGAKTLILSTGVFGRLKVPSELVKMLEDHGLKVYVKRTPEAIKLYNSLVDTEPVGALIHSTC